MVRSERITYMNGDFIPESEAKVHFRDRSFKYGDGVFDMTRTFGHKIFKIEEHVERLYKSLNYLDIKLDLSPKKMVEIINQKGFKAELSHYPKPSFRTNAPWDVIIQSLDLTQPPM